MTRVLRRNNEAIYGWIIMESTIAFSLYKQLYEFSLRSLSYLTTEGRVFFCNEERSSDYAVLRLKYEQTFKHHILLSCQPQELISIHLFKCNRTILCFQLSAFYGCDIFR